jgi:hypothetical protein
LLAHGRWFSPGIPASTTTKTGCHDIAEILLKVALNMKLLELMVFKISKIFQDRLTWENASHNTI